MKSEQVKCEIADAWISIVEFAKPVRRPIKVWEENIYDDDVIITIYRKRA